MNKRNLNHRGILGPIFVLLAFLAPSGSHACSCMSISDNFFATVLKYNEFVATSRNPNRQPLTVLTGKIVKYGEMGTQHPKNMTVQVSHVLQGETVTEEIVVNGDDGYSCRPYVENFEIGKFYALAITKDKENYAISSCGTYWQEIQSPLTTQ